MSEMNMTIEALQDITHMCGVDMKIASINSTPDGMVNVKFESENVPDGKVVMQIKKDVDDDLNVTFSTVFKSVED